jgi:hypothetical protein
MNTGYLIYHAERPRSAAEQRQADIVHAEFARSAGRGWRALRALFRTTGFRTTGFRTTGFRTTGRPATGGPATGGQLAECPAGRRA